MPSSGGRSSSATRWTASGCIRQCRSIPHADRRHAGLVAAHLNMPIRYDVRDDEPSIAEWDQVSVHTPEPVANPPAFLAGVAFLRKIVAPTRVLLYGEGPDDGLQYE